MRTLLALLLMLAMPLVLAEETTTVDGPEEFQLRQELPEKSEAFARQQQEAVQKSTGTEDDAVIEDPALGETTEDDMSFL